MCKQSLTKLAMAKITGINSLQIVNNIIGFCPKTGYGNAREQPERYWGFYTETGGDNSSLVLPVSGKTNALNLGSSGAEPPFMPPAYRA